MVLNNAVATVNGTSALHVSLIASGVQPDDEVIVPALTFISSVNVIRYCNAYPVFMIAMNVPCVLMFRRL